ncbi:MAG: precorrin-8X methylmutase [Roseburia sp.]
MSEIEYVLPEDIEKRSFAIIGQELAQQNIQLDPVQEPVIKRAIHTTADFDYAHTLTFSEDAVTIAHRLILAGADLVTDTNMALAGINKKKLAQYGGQVHCYMADEQVAALARERRVTRATISMEKAAQLEKPVIFVVGNAPTALISLHEMMKEGIYRPAFIIGVPVGFVNVEAAKELIMKSDVPYIVNRGRKGGSNVAAAICNALLYTCPANTDDELKP